MVVSKAAINNFMNNSRHKEDSPTKVGKGDNLPGSRERKKRKKSSSKDNSFGGTKNNVLKELLQMKQDNNKLYKDKSNRKNDLFENQSVSKSNDTAFKHRKMSAETNRIDPNNLKVAKNHNRSRKSNSNKPSARQSRADSRDTSTRSHKEDSKSTVNDPPANNQVSTDAEKENHPVNEDINIVTKFAFATRVGYIPNNPYKVNQDAYILCPNISKLPAFHYFGVCDGHGQNGKEVSGYVKQRLPVLVESNMKDMEEKKALTDAFVTVNDELDYVPFD